MAAKNISFLILVFIIYHSLCLHTLAQPDFLSYLCLQSSFANSLNNYTSNSTYRANLNSALSSITNGIENDYGFYNLSVGQGINKVNTIALCKGDVTVSQCRTCLGEAVPKLKELCPTQREAIGWYDDCMLRYSARKIFGEVELTPYFNETSGTNATEGAKFNSTLAALLSEVQNKTIAGDSRVKFATGMVNVSKSHTIYALMQCTPDLEEFDCLNCLEGALNVVLPKCCAMSEGARVVMPSCNIRYEDYLFYNESNAQGPRLTPIPPQSSPALPPSARPSVGPPSIDTNHKPGPRISRTKMAIIIALPLAIASAALVALSCFALLRMRKESRKLKDENHIQSVEPLQMDLATVKAATGNFSEDNKIGIGGSRDVYKGKLRNGQEIAVKRLSKDSGQGDQQFKNEVLLVAKLQHRNLVRLLGFCSEGVERLLVYEFLPNRSLDYYLFDRDKCASLGWKQRYNIIEGICRGLLYMHEDSRLVVIHRDLNSSNILLDDEWNPKISDFGVARQFKLDQTHGATVQIAGTYGYMAPEYVVHGQFSIKSDVFSFGVIVLEIITGERISSFCKGENRESLLGFVWRNWLEGTSLKVVDPTMCTPSTMEVLRCINIALLCVQENAAHRPIMSSVALMLSGSSITMPIPSTPAFLFETNVDAVSLVWQHNIRADESDQYKHVVQGSPNELSVSELDPR
ncbi:Cysteine-rich receptor-like protein [Drosera capensis]